MMVNKAAQWTFLGILITLEACKTCGKLKRKTVESHSLNLHQKLILERLQVMFSLVH